VQKIANSGWDADEVNERTTGPAMGIKTMGKEETIHQKIDSLVFQSTGYL
jgi:hypothetical protein